MRCKTWHEIFILTSACRQLAKYVFIHVSTFAFKVTCQKVLCAITMKWFRSVSIVPIIIIKTLVLIPHTFTSMKSILVPHTCTSIKSNLIFFMFMIYVIKKTVFEFLKPIVQSSSVESPKRCKLYVEYVSNKCILQYKTSLWNRWHPIKQEFHVL